MHRKVIEQLQVLTPKLFPKKSKGNTQGEPTKMINILYGVAKEGLFGRYKEVCKLNIYDVMGYLNEQSKIDKDA